MTLKRTRMLVGAIALVLVASACTSASNAPASTSSSTTRSTSVATRPTTTTTTTVVRERPPTRLPVALVWTYHQPFRPAEGVGASSPWVRLETTRTYAAAIQELADRPEARVTVQLTPSLLAQVQALADGAKDAWWELSEVPAAALTDEQKSELVSEFFTSDATAFEIWPRYTELRNAVDAIGVDAAVAALTDQDFRDLQVLFNLAWTHPRFRAMPPLAGLAAQGGAFSEADKSVLLAEHHRIVSEVIPSLKQLRVRGQVEVAAGSYSQAVLPLLQDPASAQVSDPAAIVPELEPFGIGAQVTGGLAVVDSLAGGTATGLVPAGGAISSEVLAELSRYGVAWVATEEAVLSAALGMGPLLRSSNGTPADPAILYTPRRASDGVAVFVGDAALADRVELAYPDLEPGVAGADFRDRLEAIHTAFESAGGIDAGAPPVVTVVIDGDALSSLGPDRGSALRSALLQSVAASDLLEMVTPSAYLRQFGVSAPVPELVPAAGDRPSLVEWIGDGQEAVAWQYLFGAWRDLGPIQPPDDAARPDPVLHALMAAEAGDWLSAIGDDGERDERRAADIAFRAWLASAYQAAGRPPPPYLGIPLIPDAAAVPDRFPEGPIAPSIDFAAAPAEWSDAGRFGGAGDVIKQVFYGFDDENLYVRVDFIEELLGNDDVGFEVYLGGVGLERVRATSLRDTPVGFAAGAVVDWAGANPVEACLYRDLPPAGTESVPVDCWEIPVGFDGDDVELAIPLRALRVGSGDQVWFRVVSNDVFRDTETFPREGPAVARAPLLPGTETVLVGQDPAGDDHGGGSLTYPEASVAGTLDITSVTVAADPDDLLIDIRVREPFASDRGSPYGLDGQVFDVYIDTDPQTRTEPARLLPGRNAALASGWDFAVVVDGWRPAVYHRRPDGSLAEQAATLVVDAIGHDGRILVQVPRTLLGGGDPAGWGFAVAALVRDPMMMTGPDIVARFRPDSGPWWGGGAAGDLTHPNIVDIVWPERGEQESWLTDYRPLGAGDLGRLGPDWFATIPVVVASDLQPDS